MADFIGMLYAATTKHLCAENVNVAMTFNQHEEVTSTNLNHVISCLGQNSS
jgi:hypothetical protein